MGVWLLALFGAGSASAADLYVGPSQPYATIALAVAASSPGDVIWVEPGTWQEPFFPPHDLELRSVSGNPLDTHLDYVNGVTNNYGSAIAVHGFRLELVSSNGGSLHLENCLFEAAGLSGPAVSATNSDVTIIGSTFRDWNTAGLGSFGALLVSFGDLTIQDSLFENALATTGAHVLAQGGAVLIERSRFDNGQADDGGAIWVSGPSLEVTDSTFSNNRAAEDGAIAWTSGTAITLRRNRFCDNLAGTSGTGVAGVRSDSGLVVLENNAFIGGQANAGAALHAENYTFVSSINNGFYGHAGSAVWLDGTSSFVSLNDLFAGTTGDVALYSLFAGGIVINHGLFWDNPAGDTNAAVGVGMVYSDPLLAGWPGGCEWPDIAPTLSSPVIDAGTPGLLDQDGSISDIGPLGGPNIDPRPYIDFDQDGAFADTDCDDLDPNRSPLLDEVCDGGLVDEDCDGLVDDNDPSVLGQQLLRPDADGDGWGDYWTPAELLCPAAGLVNDDSDCFDNDPNRFENDAFFRDADLDGFGDPLAGVPDCELGPGLSDLATDCNDADPFVNPAAQEITADGVDQNCDGTEQCHADGDGDGWGAGVVTSSDLDCQDLGEATQGGDCDDADPGAYPGAPEGVADGVDSDCDGLERCPQDQDSDGLGDAVATTDSSDLTCMAAGVAPNTEDCDDNDATIGQATAWYPDADLDGFGDDASATLACTAPPGALGAGGDCNDLDPTINPLATELIASGVDEDCDGTYGCWLDADLDGFGTDQGTVDADAGCTLPGSSDKSDDCDDNAPGTYPGAPEIPNNGVDEDCDYADATTGTTTGGTTSTGTTSTGTTTGTTSTTSTGTPGTGTGGTTTGGPAVDDTGGSQDTEKGCGCTSTQTGGGAPATTLTLLLLGLRRRRVTGAPSGARALLKVHSR